MRCRPCLLVAAAALLLPACGTPDGAPTSGSTSSVPSTTTSNVPSTTPSPSTSTSTSTSPTEPASTTTSPGGFPPTRLLVSDLDGVWLWSTTGERRQVIDKPVAAAIPDRRGGLIYKELETGQWEPDVGQQSTARWTWVGEGSARPIRWLQSIGGTASVILSPPADGIVAPLDVAVIDGHLSLLYVRTRHFTIVTDDTNPWWDSRVESYVVRDLVTGSEHVLLDHSTGWESSFVALSLGDDVAAVVWHDYSGESNSMHLRGIDGGEVSTSFDLPSCAPPCGLAADLPPEGSTLTWVGRADGGLAVTVIDRATGEVLHRASIVVDGTPASIDTVGAGQRTVLLVHTYQPVPSEVRPVLRRGDRGDWVRLLQMRLDDAGAGLHLGYAAPDGRFGPRTEELLKAYQVEAGLLPTGIVGPGEWELLIGPPQGVRTVPALHQPFLVADDGSVLELPVFAPAAFIPSTGQQVSLWSE